MLLNVPTFPISRPECSSHSLINHMGIIALFLKNNQSIFIYFLIALKGKLKWELNANFVSPTRILWESIKVLFFFLNKCTCFFTALSTRTSLPTGWWILWAWGICKSTASFRQKVSLLCALIFMLSFNRFVFVVSPFPSGINHWVIGFWEWNVVI